MTLLMLQRLLKFWNHGDRIESKKIFFNIMFWPRSCTASNLLDTILAGSINNSQIIPYSPPPNSLIPG